MKNPLKKSSKSNPTYQAVVYSANRHKSAPAGYMLAVFIAAIIVVIGIVSWVTPSYIFNASNDAHTTKKPLLTSNSSSQSSRPQKVTSVDTSATSSNGQTHTATNSSSNNAVPPAQQTQTTTTTPSNTPPSGSTTVSPSGSQPPVLGSKPPVHTHTKSKPSKNKPPVVVSKPPAHKSKLPKPQPPVPPKNTTARKSPSGEAMPIGNLPGWKQVFTDDFTADVPLGNFPRAVSSKWQAYSYPTKDTSRRGTYWPEKVVSVKNGMLNKHLHTENGTHMVSTLRPKLTSSTPYGQLYGRFAVRFKADPVPGYKVAWLLWPSSGAWPRDGEIDFPEGDLDKTIYAFSHHRGARWGTEQAAFATNKTFKDWHTAVIEWLPNRCTFILDGKVIGSTTDRVPNTPMWWGIQTETALRSKPVAAAAGNVQIDWVSVWARS